MKEDTLRARVLIAAMSIALMTVACGTASGEPPDSTASTPTTAAAFALDHSTTTSTAVATPTTLDPVEQTWQDITPFVTRGNGTTRFRTSVMSVPFSFIPGQGWIKEDERSESLDARFSEEVVTHFVFSSSDSMSVDEMYDALQTLVECYDAEMTEPSATEVDGASGLTFEIEGIPEFSDDTCETPITDVNERFVLGIGRRLFHIVDVNGTTVSIFYFTFPGMYDSHLDSVNGMLDSVIWKEINE